MRRLASLSVIVFLLTMATATPAALAQNIPNEEEASDDGAMPNDGTVSSEMTESIDDDQEFEPGEYYSYQVVEEEGPDEVEPGMDSDFETGIDGDPVDPDAIGVREPPEIPLLAMAGAEAPPSPPPPPPPPNQQSEPAAPNQMVHRSLMGRAVLDREAPWQAQIYFPRIIKKWQTEIDAGKAEAWEKQHYCGGALIAPNWVLTAAHCIDDSMKQAGYRIRLGQEDIKQPGGWEYSIAEVRQHDGYLSSNKYRDDIALIRIKRDPNFGMPPTSQVRTIGLYRGAAPGDGSPVTGYGWGRTSATGAIAHAVLMKVQLGIIAQSRCAAPPYYDARRIPNSVVCAAAPGRKTCRGDSGGPLVSSGQLVGIVSWGSERCADDKAPGVYTRTAAYAAWIDSVTHSTARPGEAAQ